MVVYIQLPQTVSYKSRSRAVQVRLYSFSNPIRGIYTHGNTNSGKGGATLQ